MGEAQPALEEQINEQYLSERDSSLGEASEVKVLVDMLPEGINFDDGVISNAEGYGHEIMGKFDIRSEGKFFPPYRQKWRKGVCYWQQPLVIATLFIWPIVPTYYVCFTTKQNEKTYVLNEIKRLVKIAGGDLAVIGWNTVAGADPKETLGAMGFIIKLDPRLKEEELKTTNKKFEL